eukprot:jgi/Mesvir1/1940/Mv22961-RA.1
MACLQAFSSSSPASGPLRQSQTLASLLRRCQRTQCRRRRPQTLLPPRGVWPRDVHILLLPQCRKHCLLFLREKFRLFSRLPSGWTPILLERILRQFSSRMVAGEMAVPRPRRPWRREVSRARLLPAPGATGARRVLTFNLTLFRLSTARSLDSRRGQAARRVAWLTKGLATWRRGDVPLGLGLYICGRNCRVASLLAPGHPPKSLTDGVISCGQRSIPQASLLAMAVTQCHATGAFANFKACELRPCNVVRQEIRPAVARVNDRRSRSSVKLGIRCAINDISNSGFDVPAGMPKVVEEAPAPPAPGEPSVRRRRPHGPSDHSCGKEFAFKVYGMESNPINILEEIVWNKDEEITKLKDLRPLSLVQPAIKVSPPARDFVGALRSAQVATGAPGLIAEVKKASPSRGVLRADFDPVKIAQAYEAGGAACISVLCDAKYFQGSYDYLQAIRLAGVKCPLLCKEFIIDAYQISLARSKGADAILLIAAVLPNVDLSYFIKVAKSMGMSALVEVHTAEELDRVLKLPNLEFVGINNRDLGTFKVDIHNTVRLLEGERGQAIRDRGILVVGESGLFTPDDIKLVQDAGCGAVLVGESIVKKDDPTAGIKELYGKDIRR